MSGLCPFCKEKLSECSCPDFRQALEAAQKQLLTLTASEVKMREALKLARPLVAFLIDRNPQHEEPHKAIKAIDDTLSSPPSEALSVVKEVAGALRISANQFRHAINGNSIDRKCIEGCAHCVVDKAIAHLEKVFGRVDV